VFDELLSFIGTDNGQQLKLLQKVELVKFLLSKRPDLVPLKIINEGLAELKTTNPWLFISLIDEKSNETAFELVKYFFHDKRFDKSVFFNIFMKWVGKPEPLFLQKVYREFLPLIKDDNFIKIMKHKLSADQINTIESETIEVNKIVERLNNPGNPELMIKADLYSWFQEREAGKPQLKVAKTVVIEPVPFVTGAVATLSGSFVKKIREYDSQTVKIAMAKVAGPEKKLVVVTRNGLVNHPKYKAFKRNSLNPA
jgi:hypothetical protein